MMVISFDQLASVPCRATDLYACQLKDDSKISYNYEAAGRAKHLLFLQLDGTRVYTREGVTFCTLHEGDVLFLPDGAKYRSYCVGEADRHIGGIGISFCLETEDGEPIAFSDRFRYMPGRSPYARFRRILGDFRNPVDRRLRLAGELFLLLDELCVDRTRRDPFDRGFSDISPAAEVIENDPAAPCTVKELAALCHMSESSFLRKFKDYTGGVSPMQYRNRIRILMAEEMLSSSMTLETVAELLGFYDAAHLCKIYRRVKGVPLSRKE